MEWLDSVRPKLRVGQTRERKAFLFLPMKLEGRTRWLEVASWEEICQVKYHYFGGEGWPGDWITVFAWHPKCWLD